MPATQALIRPAFAFLLAAFSAAALAQAQKAPSAYEPSIGQEGKDVVWVPTPDVLVVRMLDMAKVTAKDHVIDLGSGDGRTVIAAAKRGARALGIEYNPEMVELSKRNAAAERVGARATFAKADLFESDFSKATVITMFLLPSINVQLRPKILDLNPGTRVVSNTFDMEDWEADETHTNEDCERWCTALLWIVPAKVEGTWRTPQGNLTLAQKFQMVSGSLGQQPIADGRLGGEEIRFNAGGVQYRGRVNGDRIQGTVTAQGRTSDWVATRVGR